MIIVGGTDNKLVIYDLENKEEHDGLRLTLNSTTLTKESNHRVLQLHYERKRSLLLCLSADNKMESYVVNTDRPDSILKKLTRQTKKSLKRTHAQATEDDEAQTAVDKQELQKRLEKRDYDFALHFKRAQTVFALDA